MVFSYHGSARPRNAASSPSSKCLDDVGFWGQGVEAHLSGPLSDTPFLAGRSPGTSPRQTSFGNVVKSFNLLEPFLPHVKAVLFYASDEAGMSFSEALARDVEK